MFQNQCAGENTIGCACCVFAVFTTRCVYVNTAVARGRSCPGVLAANSHEETASTWEQVAPLKMATPPSLFLSAPDAQASLTWNLCVGSVGLSSNCAVADSFCATMRQSGPSSSSWVHKSTRHQPCGKVKTQTQINMTPAMWKSQNTPGWLKGHAASQDNDISICVRTRHTAQSQAYLKSFSSKRHNTSWRDKTAELDKQHHNIMTWLKGSLCWIGKSTLSTTIHLD